MPRLLRPLRQLFLFSFLCITFVLFLKQLQHVQPDYDGRVQEEDEDDDASSKKAATRRPRSRPLNTAVERSTVGDRILGENKQWLLDTIPNGTDAEHRGRAKVILSWNAGHGQEHLGGCPDWNCVLMEDRSRIDEADAVLLGAPDNVPNRRKSQYYVHFSQESPAHHVVGEPFPGYFNLSLGYRRDAVLSSPYGYAVERRLPKLSTAPLFTDAQLKQKTKAVIWFVSNCVTTSKREDYVAELSKHIAIDKFGRCGTDSCPKGPECEKRIRNDYRFYLALENSICKDYITEKLWNQGFLDVVPIVFRRELLQKYVPPGSFIALDDFSSPKQLADHLLHLMHNDSAYLQYFSWRSHYDIVFLDGQNHDRKERPWGFCRLCNLLWQQPRPLHNIRDFNRWWIDDAHCEDSSFVKKLLGTN